MNKDEIDQINTLDSMNNVFMNPEVTSESRKHFNSNVWLSIDLLSYIWYLHWYNGVLNNDDTPNHNYDQYYTMTMTLTIIMTI